MDLGPLSEKVNVNGGACALGHPIGAALRAGAQARRRFALHQRRRYDRGGMTPLSPLGEGLGVRVALVAAPDFGHGPLDAG